MLCKMSSKNCLVNTNLITTDEHCAKRLPDARRPAFTCPTCMQLSRPTTSISLSPISCSATPKSMSLKKFAEFSRSLRFRFRFNSLFFFFWLKFSPQRFEPPYMLGMFNTAIPCNDGPLFRSSDISSHYEWKYKVYKQTSRFEKWRACTKWSKNLMLIICSLLQAPISTFKEKFTLNWTLHWAKLHLYRTRYGSNVWATSVDLLEYRYLHEGSCK